MVTEQQYRGLPESDFHSWNYRAESRVLPETSQVNVSVNSWFGELTDQFNSGLSSPSSHVSLLDPVHTAENYLPALAASALMHLVSQEAERGEVGLATKLERNILEHWSENRLNQHHGKPLQTELLKFAEFAGIERLLDLFIKRGVNALTQRFGSSLFAETLIQNLIASLAAKETIDIFHTGITVLEKYVAINASAVDSKGLIDVMSKAVGSLVDEPLPTSAS